MGNKFEFSFKLSPKGSKEFLNDFRKLFAYSSNMMVDFDGKRYSVRADKIRYVNKVLSKHLASIRAVERVLEKYAKEVSEVKEE